MAGKYKAKKTEEDGILFDSKLEANRYLYWKEQKKLGLIKDFEMQKVFILQEGFKKNGKTHRPITYVCDFYIIYNNGRVEVEDTKGQLTEVFRIKHKMFEYRYPEYVLKLIAYDRVDNCWMDFKEYKKLCKKRKDEKLKDKPVKKTTVKSTTTKRKPRKTCK